MTLDEEVNKEVDELLEELRECLEKGRELFRSIEEDGNKWSLTQKTNKAQKSLIRDYEIWYTKARPLVKEYLPDRLSDFDQYKEKVMKWTKLDFEIDVDTSKHIANQHVENAIYSQNGILHSIPERVEVERLRSRERVSEDISLEEIQRARSLHKDEDIRAAGVIAGVALERHLQSLCEVEGLDYDPMDGISSLATTLNTENRISDDEFRLLEHLGGLRNKCSHASDAEPTSGEVDRLISETRDFVSESDIR